jgi:hypothetical protein
MRNRAKYYMEYLKIKQINDDIFQLTLPLFVVMILGIHCIAMSSGILNYFFFNLHSGGWGARGSVVC